MTEIKDKAGQKDTQNLRLVLCWFVYASSYFGRFSFSSSINSIIGDYHISRADTGLVMTFFFAAYGVGQVVNGFLCKKYSPRFTFPLALGGSSVINISIFTLAKTGNLGDFFFLIKYLWLFNGVVLSFLWTSLIFIVGKNIEEAKMSRAIVMLGTTVPIGTFFAYSVSSLLQKFGLYEWSFLLAAILMSAVAFSWLLFFSPHKCEDVLPPEKKPEKVKEHGIPKGPLITLAGLSIFAMSNNFLKDGLQTWIPTILKETYSFSNSLSLILATSIYIFGISGVFIVKKMRNSIRDFISLSALFFTVAGIFIAAIALLLDTSALAVSLLFIFLMIIGYAVNNIVTSIAPLYLRDELNPGAIAGVLDGFCYIGSAASTYALGYVADKRGWYSVILLLLITTFTSMLICLLLNRLNKRKYVIVAD